jgi:hypothetical protein
MISLLRKLIREEIGRDLKSPRPDPLTWQSYPNIHVMITADPANGSYMCQVKVKDNDELSTPMRSFKSENDAMFWARNKAEEINKKVNLVSDVVNTTKDTAIFSRGNGD